MDKKKFLRLSEILSCFLTSLRISLLILFATDSIAFISFCPSRAAVLAREIWSETTGRRQGQGGRNSFVAPDPGLSGRVVLGVRAQAGEGACCSLSRSPLPWAKSLPVAGPNAP